MAPKTRPRITADTLFTAPEQAAFRRIIAEVTKAPESTEGTENLTVDRLMRGLMNQAVKDAKNNPDDPEAMHNKLADREYSTIKAFVQEQDAKKHRPRRPYAATVVSGHHSVADHEIRYNRGIGRTKDRSP